MLCVPAEYSALAYPCCLGKSWGRLQAQPSQVTHSHPPNSRPVRLPAGSPLPWPVPSELSLEESMPVSGGPSFLSRQQPCPAWVHQWSKRKQNKSTQPWVVLCWAYDRVQREVVSPKGLSGRGFVQQEPMAVIGCEDSKCEGPEAARSRLRGTWAVVREGGNTRGHTLSVRDQ